GILLDEVLSVCGFKEGLRVGDVLDCAGAEFGQLEGRGRRGCHVTQATSGFDRGKPTHALVPELFQSATELRGHSGDAFDNRVKRAEAQTERRETVLGGDKP